MSKSDAYRLGMAAYHSQRYEQAIHLLQPLIGGDTRGVDEPTILLSRFYLGQAHHRWALDHFQHMRFKEAATHFEAAARLNPAGGGIERFLAACYVKTGRFDLATRNLESLLARNPDDSETRIRLALSLWKQSSPQEAMRTLAEGLHRQPDHAGLRYQLGVLHAAMEEYDQAEECFRQAVARDPHHAAAHERLAQCCGVRGDYQRSTELLQMAQMLEPTNSRVGLQLSLLAQSAAGQSIVDSGPEFRIDHSRSVVQNPLDRSALERLGEIVTQEPDFVDAFLSLPASDVDDEVFSTLAATLKHALARHPEYADLHYHCGAVYRRLGQDAAAIEHAERAVSINPRYVNALILLAGLYAQTERWTDGVYRLEEAIRQGGDYADVHDMLGRLYARTGRSGQAGDAFRRAVAINRDLQAARQPMNAVDCGEAQDRRATTANR